MIFILILHLLLLWLGNDDKFIKEISGEGKNHFCVNDKGGLMIVG